MTRNTSIWAVRILLAALLLAGTEVLYWGHIQRYTVLDWTLRIIGNLALAVFVLDVAARYRIRIIYDAMLLFAMYGMLLALLVAPSFAFAQFPDFLLTRTLGGYTLLGFEMWGFFLVLTFGQTRRYRVILMAAAVWLGFYWGTWLRWVPEYSTLFEMLDLQIAFAYAGGFFAVIVVLFGIARRSVESLALSDFKLPLLQWGILLAVFIGLYGYQSIQQNVTVWMLLVVAALLLVCWSVLWFRHDEKRDTLLDDHIPIIAPLPLVWLLPPAILFLLMTVVAYHAPLVGTAEYNQFWLMETGYIAVGTLWLPFTAAVLGLQGIDYQMRTGQLS